MPCGKYIQLGKWELAFEWESSDRCVYIPYLHNADLRSESIALQHHWGVVRWWSINWLKATVRLVEEFRMQGQ